jgi:hypothetical protein
VLRQAPSEYVNFTRQQILAIIVKLHIRSQYRWSPALLRAPHARGKQSTSRGIKAQRVYSEDTHRKPQEAQRGCTYSSPLLHAELRNTECLLARCRDTTPYLPELS